MGDCDADKKVTVIDATAIQKVLASIPVASYDSAVADVDDDGFVTVIDATVIQKYLAQVPTVGRTGERLVYES